MLHLTQTTFQEGLMLKSGGSVVNVVIHGKRRYQIDVMDPVAHNAFQRGGRMGFTERSQLINFYDNI